GIGLAALRNATEPWVGVMFMATLGLLATATLGAAYRRGRSRAFYAGFALFGFGYLALALSPAIGPFLATTMLLKWIYELVNPIIGYSQEGSLIIYLRTRTGDPEQFQRLGHSLFALLFGLVGGLTAR